MLFPGVRIIERPGALHFYDGQRVVSMTGPDEVVAALAAMARADPALPVTELDPVAALAGPEGEASAVLVKLLASFSVTTDDGGPPDGDDTISRAVDFARAAVQGPLPTIEARRRVTDTTVHVVADDASSLVEALRESGLRAQPGTVAALDVPLPAESLVVSDNRHAQPVNELSLRHGFAWLPVGDYDGAVIRVGPLILPGQTACYQCLLSRLASNVEYSALYRDVVVDAPAVPAPAAIRSWSRSIAVLILLRWVGGADAGLPGLLHTLSPSDLSLRTATVYRVPRCRACAMPDYLPAAAPWEDDDEH